MRPLLIYSNISLKYTFLFHDWMTLCHLNSSKKIDAVSALNSLIPPLPNHPGNVNSNKYFENQIILTILHVYELVDAKLLYFLSKLS